LSAPTSAAPAGVPSATVHARGPFLAGGIVILDEDEANHLKVRRVAEGEPVRLVDGRGGIATARLAKEGAAWAARVVATTLVPAPPATELWVGAGDRERFLSLAEKATELGATRIVPLLTERAQQVATRFLAAHVEKAARRAREAIKQCGAAWAPLIATPVPLAEVLRTAPRALRFLADAAGGTLPMVREMEAVQWAIGPEGGFTEAETAQLQAAGFKPVALGRAILRFDTAGAAALALTAHARLGSHQGGRT
jgi:16S rRNA (uracil1498-N3)-methyltransferase